MDIANKVWIENHAVCQQAFQDKAWDVLEVGSFIVPTQELIQCRTAIGDKCNTFTGVDMRPGNGVNVVCDASHMPFENDKFHMTICLDMLEHAEWPRQIIHEIFRVTKSGGYLFLATVFGFPIHDYPSDYWRFTPNCLRLLLEDAGFQVQEVGQEGELDNPRVVRALGHKQ